MTNNIHELYINIMMVYSYEPTIVSLKSYKS